MSTKKIDTFLSKISIENIRDNIEKYLTQIIWGICIFGLIIFLAIYLSNKKEEKREILVGKYYQAITEIRNSNNEKGLEILNEVYNSKYSEENIKTISGIKIAEILTKENGYEEALKIYKDIYRIKNNNQFLKDLSGLSALNIMINQDNPENCAEIENLIDSLKSSNSVLTLLVEEQEGLFELQKGNIKTGVNILKNTLLDEDLDQDTKARIELVLEIYKNENI